MRKYLLFFSLFYSFFLKGQDAHYSQIFQSPLFLNSALTGVSDAGFRLGGIYRSQWKSSKSPYENFNFYFDKSNEKFSYGLLINQNNAGIEGLNKTNVLLSFSLKKQISEGNNLLSFGTQIGFIQERFDLSKLTFDNQYNPDKGFDSAVESGENFEKTSVFLPDLNVGVNWRFSKQSSLPISGDIGISFAHINTPKSSFLNENIHFPLKSTIYGRAEFRLNKKLGIEPFLLFSKQGIANEFIFGLNSVFHFNTNTLKVGIANRAKDALILTTEFSIKNIRFGFSYDAHFQDFGSQINANSVEFSVNYLFGLKAREEEPKELGNAHPNKKTNDKKAENDYDGDGIIDEKDVCPYEAGLAKYQGCNDRDVDGVWDNVDACPSLPGTLENYGCPDRNNNIDSDDDGVLDQFDDCIYVKGLAVLNGCPDSDGDGLSDSSDDCPYLKGKKENNGCPLKSESSETKKMSKDFLEFDTNSSKINSKYYPFLDRLAFQIKNNKQLKIVIEGHTDDEGDQLYNYHLSQKRAHIVRNYFFKKGVPLEQVEMHFFGETNPKIEKKSDYAKARNRRVELIVLKSK